MSPQSAIYLVILVIVVLGLAYAINWACDQAFGGATPKLLRFGIWIIAALIILIVLLNRMGMMHVSMLGGVPLLT